MPSSCVLRKEKNLGQRRAVLATRWSVNLQPKSVVSIAVSSSGALLAMLGLQKQKKRSSLLNNTLLIK